MLRDFSADAADDIRLPLPRSSLGGIAGRPKAGPLRLLWLDEERICLACGRLDGQEGRQYIPVERTAYTNAPSIRASCAATASRHRFRARAGNTGVIGMESVDKGDASPSQPQ